MFYLDDAVFNTLLSRAALGCLLNEFVKTLLSQTLSEHRSGTLFCVCWRNWLLLSQSVQSVAGHLPYWVGISRCNGPVCSVASGNSGFAALDNRAIVSLLLCMFSFIFKPLLCCGHLLLHFMPLYEEETHFKFKSACIWLNSLGPQSKASIGHYFRRRSQQKYVFCHVPNLALNSAATAYTTVLELYSICGAQ